MGCMIQSVHRKNFDRFGYVLDFPENVEESFYVVAREEAEPWRLAVFRYRNKTIKTMECHPYSLESFEPLKGYTVLLVAEHDRPEEYEAFILDRPVCLYKGIWHQVLSLTDEAQVKISENLEVSSEFYELKEEISVRMACQTDDKETHC